jgi:hypothetical protein
MRTINPDRTFALIGREVETSVTYSIDVSGPENARMVKHESRSRELAVHTIEVTFDDKDGENVRTKVVCRGTLMYIGEEGNEQSYWLTPDGRSTFKGMPDWVYEVIEAAIDEDALSKGHWPHRVI